MEITKLFIPMLVLGLLTIIQNVINVGKGRRARQAALPVVAVIFAVVAMIAAYGYHEDHISLLFPKF